MKRNFYYNKSCSFIYLFSITHFSIMKMELKVVMTETTCYTKSKLFTVWLFKKMFAVLCWALELGGGRRLLPGASH